MSRKILVCEDEEFIRELVEINLVRSGYDVTAVSSGEEALEAYDSSDDGHKIAILDITLPGIDGFEVCKELRKQSDTMGIIMLSAKTQEMDKVKALMIGADDYITKPFNLSELNARVDVLYRRVEAISKTRKAPRESEVVSEPFVLNTKSRTLKKNNDYIDLTQVEFQILEIFITNPDILITRADILKAVWGEEYFGDDKIIDVNIRRIRKKIEDEASSPKYIKTVWGQGYTWESKKE